MISMAFDNIGDVTPNDGMVMIKPGPENDYINFGDAKIFVDTSYDALKHVVTWGEVVRVPAKDGGGIEVGDYIYFHYLTVDTCLKLRKYVTVGRQVYFPVPVASVFVSTRGGKVICHGYALVEPIEDVVQGAVLMPRTNKKDHNTKEGVLRHKPQGWKSAEVGEHVVFATAADVPLEYDLHRTFDGGKRYFRIQESNILAKRIWT